MTNLKIIILPIMLIATLAMSSFAQTAAAQNKLTIVIKNIKSTAGHLMVGLFNKKENFPKDGKQYKKLSVKPTGSIVQVAIPNLPTGEYAVAVYNDENNDKMCNTNMIGYPTESFGFSNNVKPVLSAPSFNNAKILLDRDKTITITLQ